MNLTDLFRGLVFYGTGGGGLAETGLAMLKAEFGPDWTPRFIDPDTLPDETIAAAAIVVGGRDPEDDLLTGERLRLGLPPADMPFADRFVRGVEVLSAHLGKPIGALAVVELGSLAMAATLIAGARLGIPVLDSDGTGRSIPELGLSKLDLVGRSVSPMTLVDRFGGETTMARIAGPAVADRMARQLCRAVHGRGLATWCYPAPMGEFRGGLVKGSVQAAWRVGAALGATGPVDDRLRKLIETTGGRVVCHARIDALEWRSREPFAFREFDYLMTRTKPDRGGAVRVFVKNEHHAVWINGTMVAQGPDPIALLHADTLEPMTTLGEAGPGTEVVVVQVPSLDPAWSTEAGRSLLGPERFGLQGRTVPSAMPVLGE